MPTYEYGCKACGKHWEMEQRISEDPIKKCPHCGKRQAKRLISGGGGIIFKGGGWYADLYHKPQDSGSSGESESASESSSSTSSTKSTSKPKAEKKSSTKSKSKTKSKAKKKA